jgi:hypothetical protein
MHKCNHMLTPIVKAVEFGKFQYLRNQYEINEINEMKAIPYASAIISLMYAQVCTRPDLVFVTGMLRQISKKS